MFYKLKHHNFQLQHALLKIFISLLLILWVTGFTINAISPKNNSATAAFPLLKHAYSIVCHQQQEKSITINSIHLLVCARCTGLYTGALLSSLLFIFIRNRFDIKLKLFLLSLFPMIIDIILYSIGAYEYSKSIAFVTGIVSGSIVFIYILSTLENFLDELKTTK